MRSGFYIAPTIFCEECHIALYYAVLDNQKKIVQHPVMIQPSFCSHSGKKFEPPYVELKEIQQ